MLKIGLIAAALTSASFIAFPAAAQEKSGDIIANQYICVFHEAAVPRGLVRVAAEGAARSQGGRVLRTYSNALRGFVVYNSPQGIARMQARNPGISYCEPDRVITLAPPFSSPPGGGGGGGGGGSTPTTDAVDWGVKRVLGLKSGERPAAYTGTNRAWIIDSGIDLDHPDLNVSSTDNVSFITKGKDTSPNDANGHGSHVAGTIGARLVEQQAAGTAPGMAGIAPGVKVVSVRVLDQRGSGSYSGVIAGVDHVACKAKSGDVANMSLGGPVDSALNQAVRNAATGTIPAGASGCVTGTKNIFFTLAAGNESKDASTTSPSSASTSHTDDVYVVSASDSSDKFAYFSNFGDLIDYAEPGVSIKSTYKDGGYATLSGTSMAAPHLAGILLVLAGGINGGGTVDESTYGDRNPDTIGVAY